MRDDSTDLARAIRRIAEQQALRRALELAVSAAPLTIGVMPRGDWDCTEVPGPEGMH
jgi:hypothetical protein